MQVHFSITNLLCLYYYLRVVKCRPKLILFYVPCLITLFKTLKSMQDTLSAFLQKTLLLAYYSLVKNHVSYFYINHNF